MKDLLTLVLGARGKTGRRVAPRLQERGVPVRLGSRAGMPPFDWDDPSTWPRALQGVSQVYLTYQPDLAAPGGLEAVTAFVAAARSARVERIVLLSGRGEPEAARCEEVVARSGLRWTVVRASWFAQNFDEGPFLPAVLAGRLALPVDGVKEPFIDAEDIADVATAALTEPRHDGQIYEVTGPRLLDFAEAAHEMGAAAGRRIRFETISRAAFEAALVRDGVPPPLAGFLAGLIAEVLDGRNARLEDGVERALGRRPRDFADYARRTAATGAWRAR